MPAVGFLIALTKDLSADESSAKIPVIEGENVVGREQVQLAFGDKRISRKQISLRASCNGTSELVVEGRNPVVLSTAGQRRKLLSGMTASIKYDDVIELIPGSYFFKYVEANNLIRQTCSSGKGAFSSADEGKRAHEEDAEEEAEEEISSTMKRSRLTRTGEKTTATTSEEASNLKNTGEGLHNNPPHSRSAAPQASRHVEEPIRDFRFPKDTLPLLFRLMRVRALPDWANTSSVSIADVIEGDVQVAILSNYMVDVDWLFSACPHMKKIPHVLVVHGESGASLERLKISKPAKWILHRPPLPISYGTHHSKAMFLVYPKGVRIIVHTANLIHVDWNNKSQGLWMQDFPWKDKEDRNTKSSSSPFENDLVDYLSALKWPQFTVNLPPIGQTNINAAFFRNFDYSSACVRLIASVPGYHSGPYLKKWGHMKLKMVLEESTFDKEFRHSPLVYQFSSLGSLDEKWLAEFTASMSSGYTEDRESLGLGKPVIIWPTVEDVRCSLEGYNAGNAIPSPLKNVEKDFLKKYWAKWKATHTGRGRAMPHIKTYTRHSGQKLAWFLLTSANLSKAAWGSLQKNNSQLMVRSYELGVLFLPTSFQGPRLVFSCTGNQGLVQGDGYHDSAGTENGSSSSQKIEFATLSYQPGNVSLNPPNKLISLPVPYELSPQPYTAEDVPWSWDRRYSKKDVYGQVWLR